MRDEYDVIVVGAGPGGSVAARTAAEECDVLLIEKRQEIGDPVRCAEAVSIGSAATYLAPDKKWISSEIKGMQLIAPDGTTIELREQPLQAPDVVLERKIFDRALAKEAARAGAHVMVRTRATGLITEDGAVKGVTMNRLGENFEVRSKVVIGADGVESQVGRWGGINTTLKLRDIESCVQYHVENVDIAQDILQFYAGSQYAPRGYAWAFPKGGRAANIGLGVLGSNLNAKRPIDYLNEFVADKFPEGQPVELVMGAVPVSDALETIVSDGLMLVGDAAHHTLPLVGGGITTAMDGGAIAGRVAGKAVHENDASVRVLREYETEWMSTFGKLLKRMYKAKEFIVSRSDEDLNRIAHAFQGIQPDEMSPKGITMRLLKKDPKLLLMARHMLS
ncbi:MAG: geranylgeranyl reductase family protein [Halobacteriota archaeon]